MSAIIDRTVLNHGILKGKKDRLIFTFFSLGIHATNSDNLQKRSSYSLVLGAARFK